ncbi:sensor histidine kinase [Pedobacter gandavensis]|uniref:sensor histidine kinase n=1 Tax=Pedobacter gandavensis TaxID=2679963 RepID=UPI00292F3068|nr:sensor histidine kinase [Pedobacter gandavensis]
MSKKEPVLFLKTRLHYTFWIVFFIYNYISNAVLDPRFNFSFGAVISYLLFFLTVLVYNFYATVYYLDLIKYKKPSIFKSISLLIVLLVSSIGLALLNRGFIQPLLIHNDNPINYYKYITFWLFQFIYYFSLGAAYFFVSELMKEKINSSNLEKEKIEVEANLLRSQINPHFLFNTLNMLYAKSIVYSEDLADKIQKLSEIMRYAYLPKWLENGSHAPASEEIKHILNVISIHEFRLSNENIFHFNTKGDMDQVFLPPLVLVTLAENILKHGHLSSDSPATIDISYEDGIFSFLGKNKIKTAKNHDEKSGIGIANISSRLNKYYKDSYEFHYSQANGYFYTNLTIHLKKQI